MTPFLRLFEATSAEEDYDVEKKFALEVIAGKKTLQDFPYYEDYASTVDAEYAASGGSSIVFIGGGPVPISGILFQVRHHTSTTVIELMSEAVTISRQLVAKLGVPLRIVQGDGSAFNQYGSFDTICVALEAGTTRETKEEIFKKIASQAKPDTNILVRGSENANFLNVDEFVHDHFQVVKKVPVFSGLSTTYVLHCKIHPPSEREEKISNDSKNAAKGKPL